MIWKSNLEELIVFKSEETKYLKRQSFQDLWLMLDFVLFSIKQKQALVINLNQVTDQERILPFCLH